jgi:short-subunit dehydrogenase
MAVVTGASAGIGAAFAEVLAAEGYGVVLVARRRDRLDTVARRLHERYGVRTEVLVADLSQPAASARVSDELAARHLQADLLVNNAGYGVPGRYLTPAWQVHEAFVQIMVTAVCELTYLLLPGMVDRKWGRIINVASLAGHVPAPAGHTLYAASKAFLIRFSESLDAEYAGEGVRTCAVCPGFTLSEFHDVTGTRGAVRRMPAFMWLDAPTVAAEGYRAVMAGRPVVITGRVNRTLAWVTRVLPQGLVRAMVARSGSRFRKTT